MVGNPPGRTEKLLYHKNQIRKYPRARRNVEFHSWKCAGRDLGVLARFVRAHIRYSQPSVAKGILLSSQGTVVSDTLLSVIGTIALIPHAR